VNDLDPGPSDSPASRRLEALCRLVGLESPAYDTFDVERLTGAPHVESVRWWRAMGFPEVPEGEVGFGESDVEMVRRLTALVAAGLLDDADILRMARLLGASFSRIADAQVAAIDEMLASLPDADPSASPRQRIRELAQTADTSLLALVEDSMMYVWRRHLLAALGRWIGAEDDTTIQAVGFVDISGFTRLAKDLSADQLAAMVDDFESAAFDTVTSRGGRVVKLIGDEVMFVAATVSTALDIALDLVALADADPLAPPLHCGIAHGPTINVGGDVFGSTVNLASRLADVARPHRIVLPRELVAELGPRDDIVVKPVRRAYELKGIGRMRLVSVRASGQNSGMAGALG